jgi:geranylgeranyl diphosphate synthase type II
MLMSNESAIDDHREGTGPARGYRVPAVAEWAELTNAVATFVRDQQLVAPMTLPQLETTARELARLQQLDSSLHDFLLVLINNALWRDTIATVPFARRMLLLPPCLRDAAACPAEFDEYGLNCEACGACPIGELSREAEELGYAVLVAEGTGVVTTFLASGQMDAVIGVSCMRSLERTFAHMIAHAVPGMAIPLLADGCSNTAVNLDVVRSCIALEAPPDAAPYIDLGTLRQQVSDWFTPATIREQLDLGEESLERIALEWLSLDGKRWRPFLTTAVYMAFTGCDYASIPAGVRQVALAGECIHKGSLIYDDIQDQDSCRYGVDTLHVQHGTPVALTVSLFLIGLGYRMIADCECEAASRVRLLSLATHGHCELCLGQGAELGWMRDPRPLSPDEVLDIFRKKTAPSFDVIFQLGAILGGATTAELEVFARYSETVGIAYQIRDDLEDYTSGGDVDDVRAGRPSIMIALTHAQAVGADKKMVAEAWCKADASQAESIRTLMKTLDIERTARDLLDDYRSRAIADLQPLTNPQVKILLHRLASKILTPAP